MVSFAGFPPEGEGPIYLTVEGAEPFGALSF